METIIKNLPPFGSQTLHLVKDARDITVTLNDDSQLHASCKNKTSYPRRYTKQPVENKTRLTKMTHDFKTMLGAKREEMYNDDNNINSTGSIHAFKSAATISVEHHLDPDQKNAFLLIGKQVLDHELFKKKLIPKPPEQMIMYLGGERNTGKSVVLKALTTYMAGLGVRHQL